jgi:hypothetical protein
MAWAKTRASIRVRVRALSRARVKARTRDWISFALWLSLFVGLRL